MLFPEVAAGVHRIEDAHTNWYIVQDGTRLTIVDAGLPRSWRSLQDALGQLGRRPADIEAVLLTHAHFDHIGFARRAQAELGVPVLAHERERSLASHPWRYDHESPRASYLRHPHFVRILAEMTAMGALWARGSDTVTAYEVEQPLDLPGRPEVIFTPGHTHGHCSLMLRDRGVIIVGDAFVMLDPYTGRAGPCLVAGAATADRARAMASLDVLGGLDAEVALTGHGPPWHGGLTEATARARAGGSA